MVLSQARKRKDPNFVGIINSYPNWMSLGARVSKNPDKSKPYGYRILVPVFKKKKVEGLKGFKLGTVFDISQTSKYEEYLKHVEENDQIESGEEIDYDVAIEFIKSHFPSVNIDESGEIGDRLINYDLDTKTIVIDDKTSHEAFHGLGYYIITSELDIAGSEEDQADRNEMLAELTCYLLMKKFEEEQLYKINYNFVYSYCWALKILDTFKFGEFEKIYTIIRDYIKSF